MILNNNFLAGEMTFQFLQAPNSKHQAPEKLQVSTSEQSPDAIRFWCLDFENSLVLGCWRLELFPLTPAGEIFGEPPAAGCRQRACKSPSSRYSRGRAV